MTARIVLSGLSPSLSGLNWESSSQLRIGRHPSVDIVLPDASVGQQHAEVYVTLHGWMIRDLGRSRTLVNGVPVGDKARRLQREDVLQLGSLLVKVSEAAEEQRPSTPLPKQHSDIKTTGPIVRVQASAQRSWEEGLVELDGANPAQAAARQFLTLLRGGYAFSRIDNLDELLNSLLEETLAVFNAQRGAVLLLDDAGKLRLRATAQRHQGRPHKCYSATLAERCFYQAQSQLFANVQQHTDLNLTDSAMRGDMGSVICAFLRSPRRRLGVLHLDRRPADEPFTQESLALADSVAATIAIPIEAALEVEKQWQQLAQESAALAELALGNHEASVIEHGRHVAAIAVKLAEAKRLSPRERHQVHIAALIHEIGINDGLAAFAPVIRHMYERWDGTGLPDGLSGDAIPQPARVLAVAHAAAELIAPPRGKPTQTGMSAARATGLPTQITWPEAVARIQKQAGSAYEPESAALLATLTE